MTRKLVALALIGILGSCTTEPSSEAVTSLADQSAPLPAPDDPVKPMGKVIAKATVDARCMARAACRSKIAGAGKALAVYLKNAAAQANGSSAKMTALLVAEPGEFQTMMEGGYSVKCRNTTSGGAAIACVVKALAAVSLTVIIPASCVTTGITCFAAVMGAASGWVSYYESDFPPLHVYNNEYGWYPEGSKPAEDPWDIP